MKICICGNINHEQTKNCHVCGFSFDSDQDNGSDFQNPTFFEKVTNFSKSTWAHAMNGFEHTDPKVAENRLKICKNCPFFKQENVSCEKCGCYLLVKTAWASESCPEGKWGPVELSKSPGGCGGCGGKKT